MSFPDRFTRAAAFIDLQPHHVILEVGCGNGLLIAALAPKITTGRIVGCDKSSTAIRNAGKRNANFVHAGKVELVQADVNALNYKAHSFDVVIAFNVNIFLKNGNDELAVLHRLLRMDGRLFVFYQFPYQITIQAAEPIIASLKQSQFDIVSKKLLASKPTQTIAITAKPV